MSGKILVIYNSKTGFTERYARWLSEELDCELVPFAQRGSLDFSGYSAVVYGGWFHAGSIVGLKWFREKLPSLSGKTTAIFATGASPLTDAELDGVIAHNLTEDERKQTPVFHLRSGLSYEKMGLGDRMMMSAFRAMIKKSKGEDSELYQGISHSCDLTSKDQLKPLVQYLKKI